jgi:sigma 54 modulation/S30EA-like ribosomal protein
MADIRNLQVQTHAQGAVPAYAMDLAVRRVRAALRIAPEPVLFARVKLTMAADPAVERPAIAQASIDLNGRALRSHATAAVMRDAIEMMSDKLRIQLERAARNWARLRGGHPAGTARIAGPRPRSEPAQQSRSLEDPSVVGHKSYGLAKLTPAEAAAEMELLDYDFHLFTEQSSSQDSVVYRTGLGYRLALARPRPDRLEHLDGGKAAPRFTVSDKPAPRLDVGDAETRLDALGQPFLFFINAATGRGNILYHRSDGAYGLITPADG